MKKKIILLLLLSGITILKIFSQIPHGSRYNCQQVIIPDHEMKSILDSVYPGIKFMVQAYRCKERGRHISTLYAIKESDTIIAERKLRTLQFEGSLLNDSVFRYTPATLIKANILLDLAERQHNDYYFNPYNISAGDIVVSPVFIDLKNEHSVRYMGVDSANRFLNFKAVVNLNTSNLVRCGYTNVKNLKQIVYEFQIIEGVIQGYIVTGYDETGKEIQENFNSTTAGSSIQYAKYYYGQLRKKRELIKK